VFLTDIVYLFLILFYILTCESLHSFTL